MKRSLLILGVLLLCVVAILASEAVPKTVHVAEEEESQVSKVLNQKKAALSAPRSLIRAKNSQDDMLILKEKLNLGHAHGTGQEGVDSETGTGTGTLSASWVHRKLSLIEDWFTGESVKTYNGRVPLTSCPEGFYRPQGSTDLRSVTALRVDGCIMCPRGRYGSVPGNTDAACSGNCPTGKYSDIPALTSAAMCKLCPAGRYGASTGLQSIHCTADCPVGRYSAEASTGSANCLACDFNMSGKQTGCEQGNLRARKPLHA